VTRSSRFAGLAGLLAFLLGLAPLAHAAGASPLEAAEGIRTGLLAAQLTLAGGDGRQAADMLIALAGAYAGTFHPTFRVTAIAADRRVRTGFDLARGAQAARDPAGFAAARAQIWTAVLAGSFETVEASLKTGRIGEARRWLGVREYRHATRFSRPNADATVALADVAAGAISADEALAAVRADVLDTYQARFNEALRDVAAAAQRGFPTRRAETAALAQGYFAILAPAFSAQRGPGEAARLDRRLEQLRDHALAGRPLDEVLTQIAATLRGFRAAPLSPREQARRGAQLLRFLELVPVEYARGVRGGRVTIDLELREAIAFRNAAASAFADVRDVLEQRNPAETARIAELLDALGRTLADADHRIPAPEPQAVRTQALDILTLITQVMPPSWRRRETAADFDLVAAALDRMEAAVREERYDVAETPRLEAYALIEAGPEAKLKAFAPHLVVPIEDLMWYGGTAGHGLAELLSRRAAPAVIRGARAALDGYLDAARRAIAGTAAPGAVLINAAVVVFREGLEAVLVLASLLGSLKQGARRELRLPLWWGAAAAGAATLLTWVAARHTLATLAGYGERLEAVVSIIAIVVLLLVTNWFLHDLYWTDRLAGFHGRKSRLLRREVGRTTGLVALGFASVYREGFESVLFLQALGVEAGIGPSVAGGLLGLAATVLVGAVLFRLQTRLPYKRMLIATGILIGAVLLQLVGHAVRSMQVVGWLPIHPLQGVDLPYWMGLWFGVFATWEGVALQIAAASFVIGSYLLARRLHSVRLPSPGTKTFRGARARR
jgi:high-affinity iron transporter